MIAAVDLFGYAAMVTGVTFMLPQVYTTYRTKSVEDISWGMLIIFFLNFIFCLIYDVFSGALPLIITIVVALIIGTIQIARKILRKFVPD